MLWIKVTNPSTGQAAIFKALVDTGAYSCVFPANVAPYLGHELKSVRPTTIQGVGSFAIAYPHTSRVKILEMLANYLPGNTVLYTIQDTPIDFVEGCSHFLLGVNNFLANFVLTVDYPRKVFSIRNPKSSR